MGGWCGRASAGVGHSSGWLLGDLGPLAVSNWWHIVAIVWRRALARGENGERLCGRLTVRCAECAARSVAVGGAALAGRDFASAAAPPVRRTQRPPLGTALRAHSARPVRLVRIWPADATLRPTRRWPDRRRAGRLVPPTQTLVARLPVVVVTVSPFSHRRRRRRCCCCCCCRCSSRRAAAAVRLMSEPSRGFAKRPSDRSKPATCRRRPEFSFKIGTFKRDLVKVTRCCCCRRRCWLARDR